MSEKPPIDPQSVRYALGKLNDPQNSLECMKIIREFNWKQLLDENAQLRDQLAEAREVIELLACGVKVSEWFAVTGQAEERILVTPATEKAREFLAKYPKGDA